MQVIVELFDFFFVSPVSFIRNGEGKIFCILLMFISSSYSFTVYSSSLRSTSKGSGWIHHFHRQKQENFDASVKIRPQISFRHYYCSLHVHMYCLFTIIWLFHNQFSANLSIFFQLCYFTLRRIPTTISTVVNTIILYTIINI